MAKLSRADKFMLENKDLLMEMLSAGAEVSVRENGERLEVVIPLDDDTQEDVLKKSIPFALKWKRRVIEKQGRMPTDIDIILHVLDGMWRQKRVTYGDISRQLNEIISMYLSNFLKYREENPLPRPTKKGFDEAVDRYIESEPFKNYQEISHLLRAMQVKEKEIGKIIEVGKQRIAQGDSAFDEKFPAVDAERVKKALSYWRRNKKPSLIDLAPKPKLAPTNPFRLFVPPTFPNPDK